jgi:hypothetical protein
MVEETCRRLIEEHNAGCDSACKAQRPVSGTTGCGYQREDGSLIYSFRRCTNCPQDWKIELPSWDGVTGERR